jgi:hypothetical protein
MLMPNMSAPVKNPHCAGPNFPHHNLLPVDPVGAEAGEAPV